VTLSPQQTAPCVGVVWCACAKAVEHVNSVIGPKLVGKEVTNQAELDKFLLELDGTENKSKLGWVPPPSLSPRGRKRGAPCPNARPVVVWCVVVVVVVVVVVWSGLVWSGLVCSANAILGVSMAACKAGAAAKGVPLYRYIAELAGKKEAHTLPVPAFNIINGGSHAGNQLAMQEFMILPIGASSFSEAMRMGVEVYHNLKNVIKEKYGQDATNVGDEGGFAPNIHGSDEGLDLCKTAIERGSAGLPVAALDGQSLTWRPHLARFPHVASRLHRQSEDRHGRGCLRILQGGQVRPRL